ncbi:MAG: glycogen debranching enzyme GlgX [Cytophagaceae bacterium SCN 52-12]|nr:MAG: glycogen debranching enzyme GlgX [Cytophagaceae bacterium SCN 52-12]
MNRKSNEKIRILPGKAFPLGATFDGKGVNFAIYSENATAVFLCLFNGNDEKKEARRIPVNEVLHNVWHIYVEGLAPGQLYGYRFDGPYDPSSGYRFNVNKLLIDPYAMAIQGTLRWHDSLFGYRIGHPDEDLSFDETDSSPFVPKSVVIDHGFDWGDDAPPETPYHKTIIYEAHVKGLTILNPRIPEKLRGTYAAVAHPVMIDYYKKLGITAIELMPVHYFLTDRHLEERSLTNYWGYNTIAYFAPDTRYTHTKKPHKVISEFKTMVKELHRAGIEVILDVVYNHTGEGSHMGPTICFRGIDNSAYYRLTDDRRYYMDYTGTGNTLNSTLPNVLKLIMDSLRYWVSEMHVDGFRFDLASTLARELHEVNRLGAFFDIIYQDPVISRVKLIAEPWDVGEGGYQVGKFPMGWAEWNGLYRDSVRDYWRAESGMLAELAERFTGSSDLYQSSYRLPTASINFITAHDGFTLHDLVSYNEKHNEANLEENSDGESHNRSWNCGQEGPSDDEEVNRLRFRQKRNLLTTLFLSQGVPMLVSGDESGRTQQGNNNAYCQDNEICWLDWKKKDNELFEFTCRLIHFRREHPVFSRRNWFRGQPIKGRGVEDIAWFSPDGDEMPDESWQHDRAASLGIYLSGYGVPSGDKGEKITDDSFYILFNGLPKEVSFQLPPGPYGKQWQKIIDTVKGFTEDENQVFDAGSRVGTAPFNVVVLKSPKPG